MSRLSRRKFVAAGAGIATAAGIGYLTKEIWNPPTQQPAGESPRILPTTGTPSPKPLKTSFDYNPKYKYILQDPNQTIEFKNLTEHSGDTKPTCVWSVDDQRVSEDWNCSTKLPPGTHTVRLTVRDDKTSDWTYADIELDQYGPEYPASEYKLPIKGICLNVGQPQWQYKTLSEEMIKESLKVIKDELDCNAVRIIGYYDDIILKAIDHAIEQDFQVLANPRYIDDNPETMIGKIRNFGVKLEQLRKDSGTDAITFNVLNETTIDCYGIIEGQNYVERAGNLLTVLESRESRWVQKVQTLCKDVAKAVREVYKGRITVAAGDWERNIIPWNLYDMVCVNAYINKWHPKQEVLSYLRELKSLGMDVFSTEYGCCTYTGASEGGGGGFLNIGPYDEDEQVKYLRGYLTMLNESGIKGAYCYEFYCDVDYDKAYLFSLLDPKKIFRKKSFYTVKSYRRTGS